jgi:hypothetical protein
MRVRLLVFVLALTACGQSSQPAGSTSSAETATEFVLSCADFAALTPATFAERFGAENLTNQTLPGPEGESYEATLVFADDPTRRLEITWNEDHTAVSSAMVSNAGTQWRGAAGYTIGTSIGDIERLNVMPFKLWGFDWDYGGWVSDWSVGALSQNPICTTRVRFTPRDEANTEAMGDSEFSSNDPAIRAADPIVSEFGLAIGAPG